MASHGNIAVALLCTNSIPLLFEVRQELADMDPSLVAFEIEAHSPIYSYRVYEWLHSMRSASIPLHLTIDKMARKRIWSYILRSGIRIQVRWKVLYINFVFGSESSSFDSLSGHRPSGELAFSPKAKYNITWKFASSKASRVYLPLLSRKGVTQLNSSAVQHTLEARNVGQVPKNYCSLLFTQRSRKRHLPTHYLGNGPLLAVCAMKHEESIRAVTVAADLGSP